MVLTSKHLNLYTFVNYRRIIGGLSVEPDLKKYFYSVIAILFQKNWHCPIISFYEKRSGCTFIYTLSGTTPFSKKGVVFPKKIALYTFLKSEYSIFWYFFPSKIVKKRAKKVCKIVPKFRGLISIFGIGYFLFRKLPMVLKYFYTRISVFFFSCRDQLSVYYVSFNFLVFLRISNISNIF